MSGVTREVVMGKGSGESGIPGRIAVSGSASGSPCRRRGRIRRGFTLVEALATLLLVGLVLPVALRGVMVAAEAGGAAVRRDRAVRLCESKLNELLVTGQWSQGATSGDFVEQPIGGDTARSAETGEMEQAEERDGEGYTWELTVSDWNDASLQLLEMHVKWEERGREREVVLSTVVRTQEE